MQNPRNHHIVAQVILKYFSPDGINIYQFDKIDRSTKLLPISEVAKRKDYYTYFDKKGKNNTSLENPFFSDIEGFYPKLVKALEKKEKLAGLHDYIAVLFSTQYARVPSQRKNIVRMQDELANQLFGLMKPHFIDEKFEKIVKAYENKTGKNCNDADKIRLRKSMEKIRVKSTQEQHISGMLSMMDIGVRLYSNSTFWVGEICLENYYFIISDNPAGFSFIPITPKISIMSSNMEKIDQEYLYLDKDGILELNKHTFEKADRFLYGKTPDSFNFTNDI